jgi:hypothetical protein
VSWGRAAAADEALQLAAWKAGEARCAGAKAMRMRGNELGSRLLLVLREVGVGSVGVWRPSGGSYSGRRWGGVVLGGCCRGRSRRVESSGR